MSIKYDKFYGVVGPNPNYPIPNPAPTVKDVNGCILEVQPPRVITAGNAPVVGGPSNVPQIALGDIRNTNIMLTNQSREHVCDFVLELQKNIYLKKFLKATAKAIRDAIRFVIKQLGLTDRSGVFTELINELKAFARDLRYIQKEIIQPIIDFERYVLAYITKIRAIIQWILGLPARLLQLLRDCLERLLKLIANIFTDFLVELGPISGTEGGLGDLLAAAKEVADEAGNTIRKASEAVALAAAIPAAATIGLLVPVSEQELEEANNFIRAYETNNPNPTPAEITSAGTNLYAIGGMPSANNVNNTIEQNRIQTV